MNLDVAFAPLLPLPALIALAAAGAVVAVLCVFGRTRGAWLRAGAIACLLLALANPSFTREDRETLTNILPVVVDRSGSQTLDGRKEQTDAVRQAVEERLRGLPNTEVRWIEAGQDGTASDGTELFSALRNALADVPPERVAGALFVTDGVVHDVPPDARDLGFAAPLHALITGRPDERDRRVALTLSPRFGIVGQTQKVGFRIDEVGQGLGRPVPVVVRRDGEEIARLDALPGQVTTFDAPISHAGVNFIEIEAEQVPQEITTVNNRVVLPIDGVREKLRVLLVSGEPHAGERTWRNLLKADASVDLVHFTILRPPDKQDGTPINELSLIAFPTRELFAQKIDEFDLIIFDRYARQGILPIIYFDNIARYVRDGGAVLVASGPDYAEPGSLFETPLAQVLPAEPMGGVIERAFRAQLSDVGRKHPVTRGLPGSETNPPTWAPWFRMVDSRLREGEAVLNGPDDRPLLVLARENKGRVALLLSDHAWLWARGFDGGGPHVDLLRRLSHWLMKEPDLDEEALRSRATGKTVTFERQTLKDEVQPVTVTLPGGATREVTLTEAEPGLWRGTLETPELGLHRATDGTFTTLVNVGPPNPREFTEVASTSKRLDALAGASGGSVRRVVAEPGADIEVPRIVPVAAGARASGSDWIGVRQADVSVVRGIGILPVFAGILGLLLLIGAFAATWAREGR
ncbi:hypothetical protein JOD31_002537 [Methylopila capsulata]|uniref:Membrane protein n=1 Tax=Methylopila capsulata TaxID=61654 RepID=A0A9W6MSP6_9HYPH|nr:hypothetical protein [Methylopila capsulata]MBM7852295.1 hypothetical protein [Methylopila capsulata]GLK56504.1 membrane protein [Methylopila capsulata]